MMFVMLRDGETRTSLLCIKEGEQADLRMLDGFRDAQGHEGREGEQDHTIRGGCCS